MGRGGFPGPFSSSGLCRSLDIPRGQSGNPQIEGPHLLSSGGEDFTLPSLGRKIFPKTVDIILRLCYTNMRTIEF